MASRPPPDVEWVHSSPIPTTPSAAPEVTSTLPVANGHAPDDRPPELVMLERLKAAYEGEAVFRISNIARWMGCPGSVQLIATVPRAARGFATKYNEEGSAAHRVAETALKGGPQPEEWLDRKIVIDEKTGKTFEVDEDMVRHADKYIELIAEAASPEGTQCYYEVNLSLGHLDPSDPVLAECRGTGDAVLVNEKEGWVEVGDLKYGMGIPVSATSKQPKGYALLAMLQFQKPGIIWKKASTWIFQPRGQSESDPVKRMSYTPGELQGAFMNEVIEALYAALQPDPPLVPEVTALAHHSYCHYCPAARADICPARRQLTLSMGGDPFDQIPSLTALSKLPAMPDEVQVAEQGQHKAIVALAGDGVHVLRSVMDYDPSELAAILDRAETVKAQLTNWIAGIQHRAFQLICAGTKVPGHYVKPQTKHRKWKGKKEEVATEIHRLTGLPLTKIVDDKLKSPHQIEELLPADKRKLIAKLYETPQGELVLMKGDPDPGDPQTTIFTQLSAVIDTEEP
jgi:hypothetical protein